MDIYSQKSASIAQKLIVSVIELGLLALAAWILFGVGGVMVAEAFGWASPDTIPARRVVIFIFSLVIFARMVFTMFYLMKRQMPWSEAFTVPFAFALYYVGFALLVLPSDAPLGAFDVLAIVLFVVGCALNTVSELQRKAFKAQPQNKGKLFAGGLFGWSMHINFFGDIVWVAAYAMVTQNGWSTLIVIFITGFFAFYNVPMLDRHLAAHYGAAFDAYAAKTKKLIPFIW